MIRAQLPASVLSLLANPANERVVSIATLWEIGIKVAIGKLKLTKPFRDWIDTAIADLVLIEGPITLPQIERQLTLPFHHRDPFDRLIAANR